MIHPDTVTEEEFKNATHERRQYAVAAARIDEVARRYHEALCTLVHQASVLGLHIEINTVSLMPPRMGHVTSEVSVRPNLGLWRELEALEKEAQLSELTDEQKAIARGDAWTPPASPSSPS